MTVSRTIILTRAYIYYATSPSAATPRFVILYLVSGVNEFSLRHIVDSETLIVYYM